jgi:hypothetical protein
VSAAPPGLPVPLPAGCTVAQASALGLTMISPVRLEPGALVDFDLVLGARPIPTMARVLSCAEEAGIGHRVEIGYVAMAQVDRDALTDFLQAVGHDVVRVREPQR